MRILRNIIFFICLILSIIAAVLCGRQYFEDKSDQLMEVIFSALCLLSGIGILSILMRYIWKRIGDILAYLFFGFLAGLMGTNIISDLLSGIRYDSLKEYLSSYVLMILIFGLSISGIYLVQTDKR